MPVKMAVELDPKFNISLIFIFNFHSFLQKWLVTHRSEMSFTVYDDSDVILCSGEVILRANLRSNPTSEPHVISLPALKSSSEGNEVENENLHSTTDLSFSNDGEYFLVCTNRKQLCLYKRNNCELVSNRSLARAASKVRFSPTNNDIVVADKSGDAYIFKTKENPQEQGILILGHLSMLLDIFVTHDGRFVLTTDRDEKIRVSMYPNSYNILTYCLGHKKFVTNIKELPHDKSVLVSSGGDGFLKLWDYENGREIGSVDFGRKIPKNEVEDFNKNLKGQDLDECALVLPVKHMRLCECGEKKSTVVISFYCSSKILVYEVSGEKSGLEINYIDDLSLEDEPLECILKNKLLWILTNNALKCYRLGNKSFALDKDTNSKLEVLNESWRKIRHDTIKHPLFPILYKRKYDNVQEYQERKKSRIIKSSN